VDYLDKYGTELGGGGNPPPTTVYVRRWAVQPLPTNPNNTLVLQVLVAPLATRVDNDNSTNVVRNAQEARFVTVKTRKAS
jgi:hypothetical protein